MSDIILLSETERFVLEIIKASSVPIKPEAGSDKVSYRIRNVSKLAITALRAREHKKIDPKPVKEAVQRLITLGFLRKIAITKARKTREKNLPLYEFQIEFAKNVEVRTI